MNQNFRRQALLSLFLRSSVGDFYTQESLRNSNTLLHKKMQSIIMNSGFHKSETFPLSFTNNLWYSSWISQGNEKRSLTAILRLQMETRTCYRVEIIHQTSKVFFKKKTKLMGFYVIYLSVKFDRPMKFVVSHLYTKPRLSLLTFHREIRVDNFLNRVDWYFWGKMVILQLQFIIL